MNINLDQDLEKAIKDSENIDNRLYKLRGIIIYKKNNIIVTIDEHKNIMYYKNYVLYNTDNKQLRSTSSYGKDYDYSR